MISDAAPLHPLRFIRLAGLALAVWFALLALATLVVEPADRVLVIAPDEARALRAIAAADLNVASGSPLGPIAEGRGPGFVARLYAGGAWLVLPAIDGGCLTLSVRGRANALRRTEGEPRA